MPTPRTGSVKAHGDHFDVRVTMADGRRSKWSHLPVGVTERQAVALARKWSHEAKDGAIAFTATARPSPRMNADGKAAETVGEWFARWDAVLLEQGRDRYAKTHRDRVKWLKPIAAKLMSKVTRADLETLVEVLDRRARAGDLSASTAGHVWGTVSVAFREACSSKTRALRVREDNPAAGVRGPDKGVRRAKTWLHPREVAAYLACERIPLRWRRLEALGAYLYVRTGELEALDWTDVDLDARTVHVHRAVDRGRNGETKETKTNTPRRIPIEPAILPLLEAMRRESAGVGRVIAMPPECDLSERTRKYLTWAGVTRAELTANDRTRKRITFYDATRSTGITWMALRGDEPLRIMQRAGHAEFKTTMGYVRTAEVLTGDVGAPFPALPPSLLDAPDDASRDGSETPSGWAKRRGSVWKKKGVPSGIRRRSENAESPTKQGDSRSPERDASTSSDASETAERTGRADGEAHRAAPSPAPAAPAIDAVEAALADALTRASSAAEWSTVAALARELEARRLARTATNVVPLDARRRTAGGP